MIDINGKELKVGDKVCYVYGKNASAELKVGNITKIYPSKQYGMDEECSVDGNAHIYQNRIMKLESEE